MSYQSPFKRLKVSDEGLKKIEKIQEAYDALYRHLHKEIGLNKGYELSQASRKLQESCMWYTRACAVDHKIEEKKNPQ